MRLSALAILAVASLAATSGCGATNYARDQSSSATGATAASSNKVSAGDATADGFVKADADGDDDVGAPADDTNNRETLDFGKPATPAETRAVTALVTRYYHVALTGNGTAACSMIDSGLAESAPEDYGQSPPGPSYMHGKTCPAVLDALFRHFHGRLAAELPRLHVASVRLRNNSGWAFVTFGAMPEREIAVRRELGKWIVAGLLDGEIP